MPEPQINDTVFVEGSPFQILHFSEDHGTYLSNLQWVCASQFVPVTDSVWLYQAEEPEKDTLAEWLYNRFFPRDAPWSELDEDEKSFFEHEANAVRRAVARGGFKESNNA
jgi:hypothetical protein